MSTIQSTAGAPHRWLREAREAAVRYRSTVGWLVCACVAVVAAFAITAIEVRNSVFDVSSLRILFASLLSVSVSNAFTAFGVRSPKCHAVSWAAVFSAVLVLHWLT